MTEESPQAVQLELPEPVKPRTKYTFVDTLDGFRIEREGGVTLRIAYFDYAVHILGGPSEDAGYYPYGLYGDDLMKAIADKLIDLTMGRNGRYIRKGDRADAKEMFCSALGKRVNVAMGRVRSEIADPETSALAKKMWASTHQDARVLHLPVLYGEAYKHLRADLLKYHACRLYAKYLDSEHVLDYLSLLAEWRAYLSAACADNPHALAAMNRTLDHFPVGVSFHGIDGLHRVKLDTPIRTRLQAIAVLSAAAHHHFELHARTVSRAGDDEIIAAGEVVNRLVSKRSKTPFVEDLVGHLLDYDEPYHGDLVGLARRSLHWHNQQHGRRHVPRQSDELTARPALDFEALRDAGITFLGSANAVIAEGERMEHCVGSYADKAVTGGCYLFHVDYNGDMATVEANPAGKVIQAYGPYDVKNPACHYGEKWINSAFEEAKASTDVSLTK